ncbi:MAG: hypothetical protein AMXMBFR33_66060 [Candidatus Xenobia bacterium]
MRILFFKNIYEQYWRSLYKKLPGLEQRSFAEQWASFVHDSFFYAGLMQRDLGQLGWEVMESWTNVRPLQEAWARENDVAVGPGWLKEIPWAQLKKFAPDVIYSMDGRNIDAAFLQRVRAEIPSVKVITGFIGAPTYDIDTFKEYDLLYTCVHAWVPHFESHGIRCMYEPHVYMDSVLDRLDRTAPKDIDLLFSGGLYRRGDCHLEREQLLESLLDFPGLHIYSAQGDISWRADFTDTTLRRIAYVIQQLLARLGVPESRRRKLPVIGRASSWTEMPMSQINWKLKPHIKPPAFGLDMYRLLNRAKVTLNMHAQVAGEEAANMRIFEVIGTGSCLLTDYKPNLSDFFELDREVVAYRSVAECREKARWLLDHPAEREAIARAGQERVLREYNHMTRAVRLDGQLRQVAACAE